MSIQTPDKKTLKVSDIKPYFRNARRIPESAVTAVKESIERFDYLQPIVVDQQNTIVVGHTRHAAMRAAGVTETEVYVTDLPEDKVREFRLADNRLAEMTAWDHGALVTELRTMEDYVLDRWFPDVDLELEALQHDDVTDDDVADAVKDVGEVAQREESAMTAVVCPSCYDEFQIRTDSIQVSGDGGAQ